MVSGIKVKAFAIGTIVSLVAVILIILIPLWLEPVPKKHAYEKVKDRSAISPTLLGYDYLSEDRALTEERPVEEPEPDLAYEEEDTSDIEAQIERDAKFHRIRILRQQGKPKLSTEKEKLMAEIAEIDPPAYRKRDKDYKRLGLGEDVSTLPVERKYMITADKYISAVLENSINSELSGRFIAVVDRHIFGSEGRVPLLPKGTRLICEYQGLEKVGQSRLPSSCQRAIRPDGVSLLLSHATTADQAGNIGLVGHVDNKNWERYGAAVVVSLISTATAVAATIPKTDYAKAAGVNLTYQMGQITGKVLDEYLDIKPITIVPAGSRITIMPGQDIRIRRPELIQADEEDEKSASERPQHQHHNQPKGDPS